MLTNQQLQIHYRPAKGWLNDPNGLVYYDGFYHVFYQHAPHFEQPWREPMVWGHARTKDFLHWEELPVAMTADQPYDRDGVWSGTAIVENGTLYLFYASVADGRQTVSVARSSDGIHFEKFAENPVVREYPEDGSADFRDPAIFIENGVHYLVIASADVRKKTGNLLLYRDRGTSFTDWEYRGVLYEYEDCRFCECPSFVKAGEKYLLSCSVVRSDGSHFFEVLYGDFDGDKFTPEIVSHFQKGPHEYAGQIFHAPDGQPCGRNLMISWIPGWWSARYEQCIGCLSLPLEITSRDGKLYAYPAAEVRHLVNEGGEVTDAYITETYENGGENVYIRVTEE